MHYLGIDVGKKSSAFYVTNDAGCVAKGVIPTSAKSASDLVKELNTLQEGVEVAIEAGNTTFELARAMEAAGATVFVIHPRDNAIIALSRKKTDGIDAKTLADQVRRKLLPNQMVHVPSAAIEDLRHLVGTREALVTKRVATTNQVLHILSRYSRFPAKRAFKTAIAWTRLAENLDDLRTADQVIVGGHARQALLLCHQIRELERAIEQRVSQSFADEAELLRSIPGCGPVVTSSIIAWCHPITRFGSARHFASYAGLTPSVRRSGARLVNGGTSRSGNRHLGRNFVQAALNFVVHSDEGHELRQWHERVRLKRGWKRARVALGRKLAATAYGVLRHRRPYDPNHVAQTLRKGS